MGRRHTRGAQTKRCGLQTKTTDEPCTHLVGPGAVKCAAGHEAARRPVALASRAAHPFNTVFGHEDLVGPMSQELIDELAERAVREGRVSDFPNLSDTDFERFLETEAALRGRAQLSPPEDVRILGAPGHQGEPPERKHFLGLCDECDAQYMTDMPMGRMESLYRQGVLGQDAWEAYMHVWVTHNHREACWDAYKDEPATNRSRWLAQKIDESMTRADRP